MVAHLYCLWACGEAKCGGEHEVGEAAYIMVARNKEREGTQLGPQYALQTDACNNIFPPTHLYLPIAPLTGDQRFNTQEHSRCKLTLGIGFVQ